MPLVAQVKVPLNPESVASDLDEELRLQWGASSRNAVAKFLAQCFVEVGQDGRGLFNWNLWNLRPYSTTDPTVDFFSHSGKVNEVRADGSVNYNVSKLYRSYPSQRLAVKGFVSQVRRRWPRAIAAALDDSKTAGAVAEELGSNGVGNDGKQGSWGKFMSAMVYTAKKIGYGDAMNALLPAALKHVGHIPPKAERAAT